ncbi:ABC transporter permease [Phytoactinopolyspora halotolerans]|uniref:Transport permease protein n=1 Tax=Phytoactinopolyspora halotolerans TaxID=1981512 RepID=A0A6L9S1G8_9ACTN|nr:ABC transporter permease [Phytoactinopolyspora halotolerans]NED98818.1 ABC transporter permease [Phytoactinopolyspora halotolerans]
MNDHLTVPGDRPTRTRLAPTPSRSAPTSAAQHVARLLADSATMVRRGLAQWARTPGQLVVGLLFPVMMLVMFAYFLGGGMAVEGGDYPDYLVPGLLALTMAFGLEETMVTLTQDINKGVLDRFRSMPIAESAILVGRSLLDMLRSTIGLLIMIGAGLLVGWRWHGTFAAALGAVALLLLLRFAMLWIGIYLGLVAGKPELVQAVQILVWPVAFLSNAFTSPDTMPGWMGRLAEWNPMSATAGAVRDLFENPNWSAGSWVSDNAVMMAIGWPLALLAIFVPLALRRFAALGK